ncbi:hypothetical protein DFA_12042 [Cavenderia fasciculata]|uniref:Uncharacterized protein n=1 Tax=Cavenderia fasciculata TaxID=261658 RepID=F4QFH1_CACFS|nr:uncharacterized protein DFA_12042 [Cavenderia fasciculata]EGG14272.1 hypothetical protein DFA_12042 [Cavenderia fasciculata]|eukprot:XP_004350981.1 hypothetical protein DFA_12042 [Cavenderia fasciculata]
MSTQSLKENQINSSGDVIQAGLKTTTTRQPLGPLKNSSAIKQQATAIPPSVQNQQKEQQLQKRVLQLEAELKQERALREKQVSELTTHNQLLESSLLYYTQVENTAKINNNRVRQINKLHIEKNELLEQVSNLKQKIDILESDQVNKLDMTLNNKRIRKIHQLNNENKQLIEVVQMQKQELVKLSQRVNTSSSPSTSTTTISNPSPSKINYSNFISHRSIPTTSDYGLGDDHLPGEC